MIKELKEHPRFFATKEGEIIGKRGKPLVGHIDRCGYREVLLSENGKTKNYFVHRLVAQAFIPNPDNLPCVNHRDGNKLNNSVDNLEWCTHRENTKHSFRIGLQKVVTNQHGTFRVLNDEDLRFIRDAKKLGYSTDAEIAEVIGCSRELVGRKRRELGI